MREAYIVAGVRTAIGRAKRGTLRNTHPGYMAAATLKEIINRAPGVKPEDVDDVVMGISSPEACQGLNFSRLALFQAGYPVTVPGVTVNRFCSSGLQTIAIGAMEIMSGQSDVVVAGGTESMSLVPMTGFNFSPNPDLAAEYPEAWCSMGLTAENVAAKYGVSREDQDKFGLRSNELALAAIQEGRFDEQITPLEVHFREPNAGGGIKDKVVEFKVDEGPRPSTLEGLASLKPVFKAGGCVTAGNSSQMSDGSAVVMLMSEEKVKEYGLKPLMRFVTFAVGGVPPELMGAGPIVAIPKALKKAGLKMSDIDLVELNEAFASQALACIRELDMNPDNVNPNGGAIALGHPLGCTGGKLTVQLMYELKRKGGRYGMVTMCIGGGMGAAGIFENLTN